MLLLKIRFGFHVWSVYNVYEVDTFVYAVMQMLGAHMRAHTRCSRITPNPNTPRHTNYLQIYYNNSNCLLQSLSVNYAEIRIFFSTVSFRLFFSLCSTNKPEYNS